MSLVKPKSDTFTTRSESSLKRKEIYLFDNTKREAERIICRLHDKRMKNQHTCSLGPRNSSVGNASDLVTHRWAAHHCVGGSNPDACKRSLASHAVYMFIQCTPLLVEKAGVTPEVNLRNLLCEGEEAHKWGNPPWLWNPGQTSPEVQNRGISGPTKRTCVLQKF